MSTNDHHEGATATATATATVTATEPKPDPETDTISTRISPACPPATQQVLTAAWAHDLPALKKGLDEPGRASAQDPKTGETPLHAAIRACGRAPSSSSSGVEKNDDGDGDGDGDVEEEKEEDVEAAKATVRELFQWGAIWNDVDDRDETPGCVAWRLGRTELYNLCVEAGVRAEMLFGLLDGYEKLSSGGAGDEDEDEDQDGDIEVIDMDMEVEKEDGGDGENVEDGDDAPELVDAAEVEGIDIVEVQAVESEKAEEEEEGEPKFVPLTTGTADEVKSEAYLRSRLTYSDGKLVDEAGNGVMMAWETDIMRQSVDALLPGKEANEGGGGKRILNIGFGMGIIDTMFAATKPARHHIVEAHPEVLARIASSGEDPSSAFGPSWEASGPEAGAFQIHQGRWQEICPKLLEAGEVYDAIYFDTFGEDYSQLRMFFTEYVPGLLDQDGVFSFFNGLGADRRICYDVYTRVAEMHLVDAGLDVDWKVIDVDMKELAEAGKGEWEGVKRRYWTLDKYRLPVCSFLG